MHIPHPRASSIPTTIPETSAHPLTPVSSKPGQGGSADSQSRDLRAELLAAEAAHFAKTRGGATDQISTDEAANEAGKRGLLESGAMEGVEDEEAKEAKRRKILEETRDIDADSASESESESEDDSEDETAELQRELEKIKRERAERREAEVCVFWFSMCVCV